MACITDLASDIHIELGEPSNISIPSIAKWLLSAVDSGKLSNLLMEDYSLDGNDISPALNSGGEDILKLLYTIYFYQNIILNNLSDATLNSVLAFKEGNRSVNLINKNEIAKTYKELLKEAKNDLKDALHGYQMRQIQDEQIAVYNGNWIIDCEFCNNLGCSSCRNC